MTQNVGHVNVVSYKLTGTSLKQFFKVRIYITYCYKIVLIKTTKCIVMANREFIGDIYFLHLTYLRD